MLYEKLREYSQLSIQHWLSDEVFTLGWFLQIAVLIVFYTVWLKLLDRRRATELLFIGSLAAVAKSMDSLVLGSMLGLVEYTVRIMPFSVSIFSTSITISPIIVMLAQQYTSSWKGYMLWTAIGTAFLNFVVFPVYMLVGVLKFHNWNVFFHFPVMFAIVLFVRLVFLWITGTQKRHMDMPAVRKP